MTNIHTFKPCRIDLNRSDRPTKLILSTRVGTQEVRGCLEWSDTDLSVRCLSPYVGPAYAYSRVKGLCHHSDLNLQVQSNGLWTDDALVCAEGLLKSSFYRARQTHDPEPDFNIFSTVSDWPILDAPKEQRLFMQRFLACDGLVSIETFSNGTELMANNEAVALVDVKRRKVHYMLDYSLADTPGVRTATLVHHWRNRESDLITEGFSGRIFFDVLLTRVDALISGAWQGSTHRFWMKRAHEAQRRGLPLACYDPANTSVLPITHFLDYRPSADDFWDFEKYHETPGLLFCGSDAVLEAFRDKFSDLTPNVVLLSERRQAKFGR